MRWEVNGADRATGRDHTVVLEADDEASAVPLAAPEAVVAPRPLPPAGPVAPAVRVTAEALLRAYAADAGSADAAYLNREVAVTGEVEVVGRNLFGTPCLVLKPPGDPTSPRRVQCSFDADHSAALNALRPGDAATVIGHCDGMADHVQVTNCRIER